MSAHWKVTVTGWRCQPAPFACRLSDEAIVGGSLGTAGSIEYQPATSARTSTLPLLLNSDTVPSGPTGTMTRFGTAPPGTGFRLEASGRVAPVGKAVTNVDSVWLTAVRLKTTDETLRVGTPPWPSTGTVIVAPGPIGVGLPRPLRESTMRAGTRGRKTASVGNQPWTSPIRSTVPWCTNREIDPSAPTGTMTRLGDGGPPGTGLRFEATGCGAPLGQAVTKVRAVAPTAVRLTATAATPAPGTPPEPVTLRFTGCPPVRRVGTPSPARESRMRAGVSGS